MFAAGLLHDLSKCLLAGVAPSIYDKVWLKSMEDHSTYEDGFRGIFGEPLAFVGCAAVVAWHLPDIFARSMAFIAQPEDDPRFSLCRECVVYADWLAFVSNCGVETWQITDRQVPELVFIPELSEEELVATLEIVAEHCDRYVADV